MENEKEVKRVHQNFCRRLNRLRIKATGGDKKAALNLISLMTEHQIAIRALGYRITSEDEGGKSGQLVPRTQEWVDEQITIQKANETDLDRIRINARKTGWTRDKLQKFILALEKEYDIE